MPVYSESGVRHEASPTPGLSAACRASGGRPVLGYVFRSAESQQLLCAPVVPHDEVRDFDYRRVADSLELPLDLSSARQLVEAHRIPAIARGWFGLRPVRWTIWRDGELVLLSRPELLR